MESRAHLIWRHVNKLIHDTSLSWATMGAEVRAQHEARTPEHQATVQWSDNRDTHQRQKLDGQTLRRFEHEARHGLPSELEEPLVIALEELGYTGFDDLLSELAARYGLLAAPIPDEATGKDAVTNVGDMVKEFGEAMQALAPMLADGKIDVNDLPYAQHAIDQVMDVIAKATTVVQEINNIKSDHITLKVV